MADSKGRSRTSRQVFWGTVQGLGKLRNAISDELVCVAHGGRNRLEFEEGAGRGVCCYLVVNRERRLLASFTYLDFKERKKDADVAGLRMLKAPGTPGLRIPS